MNKLPTDLKLKELLCRVAPAKMFQMVDNEEFGRHLTIQAFGQAQRVFDSELLSICWDIEETLQGEDMENYSRLVHLVWRDLCKRPTHSDGGWRALGMLHADWRARIMALAILRKLITNPFA